MVVAAYSWPQSPGSLLSSLPMSARELSSEYSVSITSSLVASSLFCSASGANWFLLAEGLESSLPSFATKWLWFVCAATVVQSVLSS